MCFIWPRDPFMDFHNKSPNSTDSYSYQFTQEFRHFSFLWASRGISFMSIKASSPFSWCCYFVKHQRYGKAKLHVNRWPNSGKKSLFPSCCSHLKGSKSKLFMPPMFQRVFVLFHKLTLQFSLTVYAFHKMQGTSPQNYHHTLHEKRLCSWSVHA